MRPTCHVSRCSERSPSAWALGTSTSSPVLSGVRRHPHPSAPLLTPHAHPHSPAADHRRRVARRAAVSGDSPVVTSASVLCCCTFAWLWRSDALSPQWCARIHTWARRGRVRGPDWAGVRRLRRRVRGRRRHCVACGHATCSECRSGDSPDRAKFCQDCKLDRAGDCVQQVDAVHAGAAASPGPGSGAGPRRRVLGDQLQPRLLSPRPQGLRQVRRKQERAPRASPRRRRRALGRRGRQRARSPPPRARPGPPWASRARPPCPCPCSPSSPPSCLPGRSRRPRRGRGGAHGGRGEGRREARGVPRPAGGHGRPRPSRGLFRGRGGQGGSGAAGRRGPRGPGDALRPRRPRRRPAREGRRTVVDGLAVLEGATPTGSGAERVHQVRVRGGGGGARGRSRASANAPSAGGRPAPRGPGRGWPGLRQPRPPPTWSMRAPCAGTRRTRAQRHSVSRRLATAAAARSALAPTNACAAPGATPSTSAWRTSTSTTARLDFDRFCANAPKPKTAMFSVPQWRGTHGLIRHVFGGRGSCPSGGSCLSRWAVPGHVHWHLACRWLVSPSRP